MATRTTGLKVYHVSLEGYAPMPSHIVVQAPSPAAAEQRLTDMLSGHAYGNSMDDGNPACRAIAENSEGVFVKITPDDFSFQDVVDEDDDLTAGEWPPGFFGTEE